MATIIPDSLLSAARGSPPADATPARAVERALILGTSSVQLSLFELFGDRVDRAAARVIAQRCFSECLRGMKDITS